MVNIRLLTVGVMMVGNNTKVTRRVTLMPDFNRITAYVVTVSIGVVSGNGLLFLCH